MGLYSSANSGLDCDIVMSTIPVPECILVHASWEKRKKNHVFMDPSVIAPSQSVGEFNEK